MILIIYAVILKLNLLLIFKYIFEKPCDIKKLFFNFLISHVYVYVNTNIFENVCIYTYSFIYS